MAYRHLGFVLLACALFGVLARPAPPVGEPRPPVMPSQTAAPLTIDGLRLGLTKKDVRDILGEPRPSAIGLDPESAGLWVYESRRAGRVHSTTIVFTDDRVTSLWGTTLTCGPVRFSVGDACPLRDENGTPLIAGSIGEQTVDFRGARITTREGRIDGLSMGDSLIER